MKEKVWINIPAEYKSKLDKWFNFYRYNSEDEENGNLVVYSLNTNSKEYISLIDFMEKNNIYHYIFRRVYTFTELEKDSSEILWFWTDDDAKESYTLEQPCSICPKCGNKILHIMKNKLYIDYKKIKKYDIMSTYNGDVETIVSEKVKQIFLSENISGVEFNPIYQIGKEDKVIEGFYHLILTEGIGDVIEPSIVNKKELCSECGFYEKFICQTPLNFHRSTWKGLDICYTKNWFGGPPKFKNIIISNKLYKTLKANNIKNIYFQPAYLIG